MAFVCLQLSRLLLPLARQNRATDAASYRSREANLRETTIRHSGGLFLGVFPFIRFTFYGHALAILTWMVTNWERGCDPQCLPPENNPKWSKTELYFRTETSQKLYRMIFNLGFDSIKFKIFSYCYFSLNYCKRRLPFSHHSILINHQLPRWYRIQKRAGKRGTRLGLRFRHHPLVYIILPWQ